MLLPWSGQGRTHGDATELCDDPVLRLATSDRAGRLAVLEADEDEAGELARDSPTTGVPGGARRGVSAAPPGWLSHC